MVFKKQRSTWIECSGKLTGQYSLINLQNVLFILKRENVLIFYLVDESNMSIEFDSEVICNSNYKNTKKMLGI